MEGIDESYLGEITFGKDEKSYDLWDLDIDAFLIISPEEGNYIQTEDDIFFIKSLDDFKQVDLQYILFNEDKDGKIVFTQEQFEEIKKIFNTNK